MADPISLSSGLLTLVVFALKSCKSLYQLVDSFRESPKSIRDLKQELEALDNVLQNLQETAKNADIDLTALKLPLVRCAQACEDFKVIVEKCTSHSGGKRPSLRDWAKLRYMGDNIDGFKNTLAGYKSTITIALSDANLRTAVVTADLLNEYKILIENTKLDLQDHLEQINDKLESLPTPSSISPDEQESERIRIQDERDSTQQCLDICAKVSAHIMEVQRKEFGNSSSFSRDSPPDSGLSDDSLSAQTLTFFALDGCNSNLTATKANLQKRLHDLNAKLQQYPTHLSDQKEIKEQLESIKQCLAICDQAAVQAVRHRTNVFEDFTTMEDGHQVIVSTIGELIAARRFNIGPRTAQWMGQMSDESVQRLSKDRVDLVKFMPYDDSPESTKQFENRYGAGFKLNSKRSISKESSHKE